MTRQIQILISELLRQAGALPGVPQTLRLTNNLKIDATIINNRTYLRISRSTNFPLETDWRTIRKYWPYPITAWPQRFKQNGRYYLAADWPTPPELPIHTTGADQRHLDDH